ncbi:hypothetical protein QTI66_00165 [Variovorax sp. J22R133]|uniref:hypothetical protein n=1 Tax=Variovorax brevis TaxID=3053503 RepID=UPI00257618E4|nr:hypothetical protein [Variovorax sp. J22R133]MDM0110541.1 hypothetical protein [Variovorax sp. J22R133]
MREHFSNVEARFAEAAQSFVESYAPAGFQGDIRSRYVDTSKFNAAAWREGQDLVVGISAAAIPLLTMLFAAILSDSDVLPSLPTAPEDDTEFRWEARFIMDPSAPSDMVRIEHALTPERMDAAYVLADLCVSFLVLHELGHVACGHVQALEQLLRLPSLVEHVAEHRGRVRQKRLRQYWEYQADAIGASLLLQYVETLAKLADSRQSWLRKVAPQASESEMRIHCAALASMAVATMFIYLEQCRLVARAEHFHPHPVVRALYIKDIVANQAVTRWNCEAADVGDLQFDYLDPFLRSLERIGLGTTDDWEDQVLTTMIRKALRAGRSEKLRDFARPWSWIPVDSWG